MTADAVTLDAQPILHVVVNCRHAATDAALTQPADARSLLAILAVVVQTQLADAKSLLADVALTQLAVAKCLLVVADAALAHLADAKWQHAILAEAHASQSVVLCKNC